MLPQNVSPSPHTTATPPLDVRHQDEDTGSFHWKVFPARRDFDSKGGVQTHARIGHTDYKSAARHQAGSPGFFADNNECSWPGQQVGKCSFNSESLDWISCWQFRASEAAIGNLQN